MKIVKGIIFYSCIFLLNISNSYAELSYSTFKDVDKFSAIDFYEFVRLIVIEQPEYSSSIAKNEEFNLNKKYAQRQRFPTLTAALVNDRSISRDVDDFVSLRKRRDDSFDGVITLDQPIYLGNKINSQVRIAKAQELISREEFNEVTSNLIITASQIYLSALSANEIADFTINQLRDISKYKDFFQRRFQAGAIDSAEMAAFNVKLSELEAKEAMLTAKSIQASEVYQSFYKRPYENLGYPEISLSATSVLDPYSIGKQSYMQKKAELEIDNQKSQVENTKSQYRPQLGFSMRFTKYDIDESEIKDEDLRGGFYFSFPLFNFGRGAAQVGAAKAKLKQAKIDYNQTLRDTDQEKAYIYGTAKGIKDARNKINNSLENIRLQKQVINLRISSSDFLVISLIDAIIQEINLLQQLMETEQQLLILELQANHINRNLLSQFSIAN